MASKARLDFELNYKVNQQSLNQAINALKSLQNIEIDNSTGASINEDLVQAKKSANDLERALRNAFDQDLGTINIDRFNAELAILKGRGSSLQQIYDDMKAIGPAGEKAFNQVANSVLDVNKNFKETKTILNTLATSLTNTIVYNISQNTINTITGSINQAIGYVKNLDSSLNDIRIVTGSSADEMERFAVQANKAAQELGASTKDIAQGALIYYQQGDTSENAMYKAQVTQKAANISGVDAATMSDYLTAIWNGYNAGAQAAAEGMQVYDAYADKVAAVAATTASDFSEVATAMGKVAPLANSMGISFDQLTAQISAVVSVTRQAPETVGTALRTIYTRMADLKAGGEDEGVNLGKVSGGLASYGINVLDSSTGDLRDMGDVIDEVAAKWDTWDNATQQAVAVLVAGTRQVNIFTSLMESWESQYLPALDAATNKSAGALQEMQDIYEDRLETIQQKSKTAWEAVYKDIVDEDLLKDFYNFSANLANAIDTVVKALGGAEHILPTIVGLVGKLIKVPLSQEITKISKQLNTLTKESSNNNAIADAISRFKSLTNINPALQSGLDTLEQFKGSISSMTPAQREVLENLKNQRMELEEQKQEYKTLLQSSQDYLKIVQSTSNNTNYSVTDLGKDAKEREKIINDYEDGTDTSALLKLFDTGMSEEHSEKIWSAVVEYDESLSGSTEEQIAAYRKLQETIKEVNAETGRYLGILENAEKTEEDFRRGTNEANTALEKLKEEINFQNAVSSFINLTSSITFAQAQFSNLNDAIDTFLREEGDLSEVILQLVSSLLMSVPAFISLVTAIQSFLELKKVQSFISSTSLALSAFKNEVLATAVSEGILTVATNILEAAVEKLNATLMENPLIAIIAAITAVFLIIKKVLVELEKSFDKQDEKLNEMTARALSAADGQKKLTDSIKNTKDALEETSKAIDEIIDKYNALDTELKELQKKEEEGTATKEDEARIEVLKQQLGILEAQKSIQEETQNNLQEQLKNDLESVKDQIEEDKKNYDLLNQYRKRKDSEANKENQERFEELITKSSLDYTEDDERVLRLMGISDEQITEMQSDNRVVKDYFNNTELNNLKNNVDLAFAGLVNSLHTGTDKIEEIFFSLENPTQDEIATYWNAIIAGSETDEEREKNEKLKRTAQISAAMSDFDKETIKEIDSANTDKDRIALFQKALDDYNIEIQDLELEEAVEQIKTVAAKKVKERENEVSQEIGDILGLSNFDGVINSAKEFSSVMKKVNDTLEASAEAAEEYASTGKISISTANSLIESNENYIRALEFTEDGIKLLPDKLKEVDNTIKSSFKTAFLKGGNEYLGISKDYELTDEDISKIQNIQKGKTETIDNKAIDYASAQEWLTEFYNEYADKIDILQELVDKENAYNEAIAKQEKIISNANTRISTWTSKMNQLDSDDYAGQLSYMDKIIEENETIVDAAIEELKEAKTEYGENSAEATEAYNKLTEAQEALYEAEQDRIEKVAEQIEDSFTDVAHEIELAVADIEIRSMTRSKYDYAGKAQDITDTYEQKLAEYNKDLSKFNEYVAQGAFKDSKEQEDAWDEIENSRKQLQKDEITMQTDLLQNSMDEITQTVEDSFDDYEDKFTEIANKMDDLASDNYEGKRELIEQEQELYSQEIEDLDAERESLKALMEQAKAQGNYAMADTIQDELDEISDKRVDIEEKLQDKQKEERQNILDEIENVRSETIEDIERECTNISNAVGLLEDYQYDEKINYINQDNEKIAQVMAANNAAMAALNEQLEKGGLSEDQIKTTQDKIEDLEDSNTSLQNSIDNNTKSLRETYTGRASFDLNEALDESNLRSTRISNQVTNLKNDTTSNNESGLIALGFAELDEASARLEAHEKYIQDINNLLEKGILTQEQYNELIEDEAENYEKAVQDVKDQQQAINDLFQELQDNAQSAWEDAKDIFENYIDDYLDELKEKVDDAKDALDDYKDALQDLWDAEDARDEREDKLRERKEKAEERATQLTAAASGDLSALANVKSLDEELEDLDEELQDDIIQDIRDALLDYIDDQKDALDDMYDLQEEWFEDYKESAAFFSNINSLAEGKGINVNYLGNVSLSGMRTYEDKKSGDYYAPNYESDLQTKTNNLVSYQDYMNLSSAARSAIAKNENWSLSSDGTKYISDSGAEVEAAQAEIIDNLTGHLTDTSSAIAINGEETNSRLDTIIEWMNSVGLSSAIESLKSYIESNGINLDSEEGLNKIFEWFGGMYPTSIDWLKQLLGISTDDISGVESGATQDIIEKYSLEDVFNGQWGNLQSIDDNANKIYESLNNIENMPMNLTFGNVVNVEGSLDSSNVEEVKNAATEAVNNIFQTIKSGFSSNGTLGIKKNR